MSTPDYSSATCLEGTLCVECSVRRLTVIYPNDGTGPYCNQCYNRKYPMSLSLPVSARVTADGSTVLNVNPMPKEEHDPVNHPRHYKNHPSGVECITVTEHMNFCLGNAIKYIWRAGEKDDQIQDLEKAAWYLSREITRLKKKKGANYASNQGNEKS